MYYIYVLKSLTTGKRYIGQTADLEKRISRHNNKESTYTKSRGPWVLVYNEVVGTRSEAVNREHFLKSGKGREFLNNLRQ